MTYPRLRSWWATAAVPFALFCAALPAAAQSGAYIALIDGTEKCSVVITPASSASGLTITLAPVGSDECGRTTVLTGRLSPGANPTGGNFSGTIYRCTTDDLEEQCKKLGRPIGENFSKPATGTFNNTSSGLIINVTYPAEKWVKEDCKFQKQDKGSVVVLISSASGRSRGVTYDDLTRSVLYFPPGHPMNPGR